MGVRKPVRERLLDAADAMLFVDGATATPVDALLRRAGCSPASLYAQFGNKDGLIAAALERRLRVWTQVWDAAIARASDPEGRLLAVFDALRDYQRDHLAERWCAFSGTAATMPSPPPAIAEVLGAENTFLRERLAELCRDVAGDTDEARELTDTMLVLYVGTLALMLREPDSEAISHGEAAARRALQRRDA